LIERLNEVSPGIKSIVVSAFKEAVTACKKVVEGVVFCVMPKPVDIEYLKETIKSALRFANPDSN
jgi:DNA-binding NtrC family response regulator